MLDVLIIDNHNMLAHPINREGVSVTVYDDEIRALNTVVWKKPDIILLNYAVQNNNTAAFISLLSNANEQSKIVLIAPALTDDEILDCLIAGATGFLEINEMPKFINKLLPAVHAGEAWITRRMVAKLIARLRQQAADSSIALPPYQLTHG